MSDKPPKDGPSTPPLQLVDTSWYKSDELIEKLDTSRRTFFRMINRDEIQKKETSEGMRYRPVDPKLLRDAESSDVPPDDASTKSSANGTDSKLSAKCHPSSGTQNSTTVVVAVPLKDWSELQRKVGRLEVVEAEYAELKSARARLHVSEGRRELAEERLDQKNQELERAQDEIKRLRRDLEQVERNSGSTWSFFS